MIKAVLFDLDNTLIDFMGMKKASVDAAISAMIKAGLKMNKKSAKQIMYELYKEYGIEYNEIFQEFLRKGNQKIDYKILAVGIVAYRKMQDKLRKPYDNVEPTLKHLKKQGLKLGIVSDAHKFKAWMRLVELKIQNYFDVVVTFDDTQKYKPDKEPFLRALKQLKLKAKECIMVGDWPKKDMEGANAVGITTVFAKYGATRDLDYKGANYTITNIGRLKSIVAELNAK